MKQNECRSKFAFYDGSKSLTNEYAKKYKYDDIFNNKHLIFGCVFDIFMVLHTMAHNAILTTICKERTILVNKSSEDIANEICSEVSIRYTRCFIQPAIDEKILREMIKDEPSDWSSLINFKDLVKAISNKNNTEINDDKYKHIHGSPFYGMSKSLVDEFSVKYKDDDNIFNNKHMICSCVFNIFVTMNVMSHPIPYMQHEYDWYMKGCKK